MNDYVADVTREDGWWLATVRDLPGAHTEAPTLARLRSAVREVIILQAELADDATPSIDFEFDMSDEPFAAAIKVANRRRQLADAQARLSEQTPETILALRQVGLGVRDIAELVGVTPGRVSQLVPA